MLLFPAEELLKVFLHLKPQWSPELLLGDVAGIEENVTERLPCSFISLEGFLKLLLSNEASSQEHGAQQVIGRIVTVLNLNQPAVLKQGNDSLALVCDAQLPAQLLKADQKERGHPHWCSPNSLLSECKT